ncbi:MAG: glycosyltransferase [Chloroflexi bacterium]|nr:glycosyltransferase [Chloroflexota bacterium]
MRDFSIIVPTYNRPDKLATCVAALCQLDYPAERYEIIIVDDGSPQPLDAAVIACVDAANIRLVRQENQGPGGARNRGAAEASGRFLALTDDDCVAHPKWLAELGAALEAHPDAMVGGHTINHLTENPYASASQAITDVVYRHYNPDPQRATFFTSNNMAMARSRFLDLGGFSRQMRLFAEDRELCDRWRFQGGAMRYLPSALMYHRHNLTLRTYLKQHYRYGRGAYHFHRMRAARGSGTLLREASFHADLDNWLLRPIRETPGWRRKLALFSLIGLWQAANLVGYFSAAIRPDLEAAADTA